MCNRIYLALLILLTYALNIQAQSLEVRGKVVDEKGQPLPYAVIQVKEKGNVAATNINGEFSFKIARGSYTIQASLLGYKPTIHKVEVTINRRLTIVLKEDYKQLGEVLVVGPNHSEQLQRGVYAAKSLNVRPYIASSSSLNQLLNYTSGVRIREEGGIGSNFDLSLNGMGGNAVRYFIDGVPLTSLGSGANIANLPINIVDRVEVYKGVVPSELGLDALGGAVNIITRKEKTSFMDLSVNGGSFHTYGADFNGQYRHKGSGFTLKGNGSYISSRNNYLMKGVEVWDNKAQEMVVGNYPRFHDGYNYANVEGQIGFTQTSWADEALLGFYISTSKSEIQTGFSQELVIGEAERHRDAFRASLNYSKRDLLVKGLTAKIFTSFTYDHIQYTDTCFRKYEWDGNYMEGNSSEVTRRGKMIRHTLRPTTVVRGNLAYTLSPSSSLNLNYTLTANLNNRRDDYDETFEPTSDYLARHIIGLSYSRYFWNDRVNTTLFLKDYILHARINQADMYWITYVRDVEPTITRNNIGFGLGSRVALFKEFSLKGSYEYATRLPTARELLGNGASIYPNFKLEPERAHNVNLVLYGTWHINELHKLNYEGSFFVRDVFNYIRRDVLDDVQSQYTNVGKALILGSEVDINYQYKRWLNLSLNATYVDERNKSDRLMDGRIDINYNSRIPNKPFLYTNVNLGVNFQNPFTINGSELRLNATYGYVHWFYLTWSTLGAKESKAVIPTQMTTNIGATWTFNGGKQSVSLNCNNLFDQINYDNFKMQKPGRSLLCKLTTFF